MKKFVVPGAALAFSASASAAGMNSRAYTCGGLHALIAAKDFIYIGIPLQGFAVSGADFCAGSERLDRAAWLQATAPHAPCRTVKTVQRKRTTRHYSFPRELRPLPGEEVELRVVVERVQAFPVMVTP